jgi:ribose-phosphate pyrophosphokinase
MAAMSTDPPVVLHFPDQHEAAARFAAALGVRCAEIASRRFPDGESLVRLPLPLPERVLLFCSLGRPNERLVELLLATRTARQHGAAQLTLIAPYLCYMRQDAAFSPGEAISQTIVGGWLADLVDAVVTVDPHLHRIARLEQAVPIARAVALSAAPALGAFIASAVPHAVIVGPDEESAQWAEPVARQAQRPFAVFAKERRGDRDVVVRAAGEAPIAGRPVVLVDDIASSGRTLGDAARVCQELGARSVDALVTHALCVGDDLEALHAAGIGHLWSTDALPHPGNRVRLAALLAQGCRDHGLA